MSEPIGPNTQLRFTRDAELTVMKLVYGANETGRWLYQVHDASDGLTYALKVFNLSPGQTVETIRREVVALNKLNQHPDRLPRVRSVQVTKGRAFVVMDWMEGKQLDLLTQATAVTNKEELRLRLGFIEQACRTVALLHDLRMTHRDLKPQNLLARDPRDPSAGVVVLDLGLAGEARGIFEGTKGYAAPEQAGMRHLNLSVPTDIFAIGQVLCFMLTGAPLALYPGDDGKSWTQDVRQTVLSGVGMTLPDALGDLARDCLQFQPEARPKNARAVHSRLTAIRKS